MTTVKEQREIIEAYERGEEIMWRKKNSNMSFVILKDKNHEFNFGHFEYKKRRWKAEKGEWYYYIDVFGVIIAKININGLDDDYLYRFGNYFRTKKDAEEARDLEKEILIKFHEENE